MRGALVVLLALLCAFAGAREVEAEVELEEWNSVEPEVHASDVHPPAVHPPEEYQPELPEEIDDLSVSWVAGSGLEGREWRWFWPLHEQGSRHTRALHCGGR